MARFGSALANGVRQYAVSVDNAAWYQLESSTGGLVAASGLAAAMPVMRWRGQMGTGTTADQQNRQPFDYTQGLLLQNRSGVETVYLTTTVDQTGAAPAAGERAIGNCIAIAPGGSLKLDNTDATKVYLRASGAAVVAVLCT